MSYGRRLAVWEQAARDADLTVALPGRVPMFFRRVPAGRFRMGSRIGNDYEQPVHTVVVPHDFHLGTFVVTQEQYRAVAGRCADLKQAAEPSGFEGARRPVEQVSWHDAVAFCTWLNSWKGLPRGCVARLPTEAEWEYACRAGSDTDYYSGDGEAVLADIGWYEGNSGRETHPVDERPEAHPFGLFGLHGNVWEWCQDVFDPQAYRKRPNGWVARHWTAADAGEDAHYWSDDYRKLGRNQARVLRGGSWFNSASFCRSAFRDRDWPFESGRSVGFRVCLVRGPSCPSGTAGPARAEAEKAGGGGVPSGARP